MSKDRREYTYVAVRRVLYHEPEPTEAAEEDVNEHRSRVVGQPFRSERDAREYAVKMSNKLQTPYFVLKILGWYDPVIDVNVGWNDADG